MYIKKDIMYTILCNLRLSMTDHTTVHYRSRQKYMSILHVDNCIGKNFVTRHIHWEYIFTNFIQHKSFDYFMHVVIIFHILTYSISISMYYMFDLIHQNPSLINFFYS